MTVLQSDRNWEKNQLIRKLHVLLVDYNNMGIIKMKWRLKGVRKNYNLIGIQYE